MSPAAKPVLLATEPGLTCPTYAPITTPAPCFAVILLASAIEAPKASRDFPLELISALGALYQNPPQFDHR